MSVQQAPFVKQLAANDRPTRDTAVASLRTYLSGKRKFEELELLKLWKGLFFCMWMSDRPRTQQRLAIDLAGLVNVLPDENVVPFLRAFWNTMAREWNGIDVLRMDKFLFLVRGYLNATFQYLARTGWETAAVEQNTAVLLSIPLSLTDQKVPNGLRYHVIDIYVDELDKTDSPRSGNLPLQTLLEPLRQVGNDSPTKSVRTRAKDAMADERLENWLGVDGGMPRTGSVEGVGGEYNPARAVSHDGDS
ncbi:MAG: hypothetical protein M1812_001853 [Candelaria pacifica]|nr:MAG: hypothetical protein M1812_001853 [Candelaria pacifica]